LTDEAVQDYDTNTKMSPPLRSQGHIDALLEGLGDGTVDAIASDHAPHHADEKALEYDQAPFGIIGLETSVGLAMDRLVSAGVISLERLIELCATNPARILSLQDRGTFRAGTRADVTILDHECVWTFDVARSKSRSRNTPFDGYRLSGAAIATIVGGRVVYLQEEYSQVRKRQAGEALLD
jgi:dihydroorotase